MTSNDKEWNEDFIINLLYIDNIDKIFAVLSMKKKKSRL